MNVQQQQCNRHRIEDFLDGLLSEAEQALLEAHLGECAACRELLANHSATAELWDKASRYLRDDEDEPDSWSRADVLSPAPDCSHAIQPVLDSLNPTDDPQMLGRLGGYEITGVVGAGAMGVVLKGFDKSLDRTVAIKVMAPHLASHGAARKRFAREAKAAAAVLHPNVMAIHSVSIDRPLPYLVMPCFRGASLQKRLDQEGPLPLGEVLRIGSQIAAGLAAAHGQGIVHRDIKPANILLEEGVERVAITDFGLARAVDDATMTRTGIVAGTPQYMSPEQARGEAVDQRSDLFSLGSVLYAMCTGRPPFRAESSYGVLSRITDEQPRPIREISPDIPEWLCAIIAKLMSKHPDDRFASAEEVAGLLEDCLAHVQQPTAVPLPEKLFPCGPGQNQNRAAAAKPRCLKIPPAVRLLVAAGLALVLLCAGIILVLEWNKGTLTIESDADNVPVRISLGDQVVDEMVVTRDDKSVRIAAGRYKVELLAKNDVLTVRDGVFTLSRGQEHFVRIRRVQPKTPAARRDEPGDAQLWNTYGVTPGPVSPLTAKLLEWMGLGLRPITKDRFRDKNVLAKYAGGLDVTSLRNHGPAAKAGANEMDIVVGIQGQPTLSLEDLDSGVQLAVEQIKHGDANSLKIQLLRSGKTIEVNVPLSAEQLDDEPAQVPARQRSSAEGRARRNEPGDAQLWNIYGVTPEPVSPLTATVLEWTGLHLRPITKKSFRNKNVFAKYAGGLDVTSLRTHGPAEKAGLNAVDIVVGIQGKPTLSLEDLDAAVHHAVEQIKHGDADSLEFQALRSGETIEVNVPFPAGQLDDLPARGTAKQQPSG